MPGEFKKVTGETLTHELRQRKPLPDERNSCRDDDERRSGPSLDVMQARVWQIHIAELSLRRFN
jgi:hypothetical protein